MGRDDTTLNPGSLVHSDINPTAPIGNVLPDQLALDSDQGWHFLIFKCSVPLPLTLAAERLPSLSARTPKRKQRNTVSSPAAPPSLHEDVTVTPSHVVASTLDDAPVAAAATLTAGPKRMRHTPTDDPVDVRSCGFIPPRNDSNKPKRRIVADVVGLGAGIGCACGGSGGGAAGRLAPACSGCTGGGLGCAVRRGTSGVPTAGRPCSSGMRRTSIPATERERERLMGGGRMPSCEQGWHCYRHRCLSCEKHYRHATASDRD
jgi:hypothetical protein